MGRRFRTFTSIAGLLMGEPYAPFVIGVAGSQFVARWAVLFTATRKNASQVQRC